jgi:hypothetical protein
MKSSLKEEGRKWNVNEGNCKRITEKEVMEE